MTWKEGSTSARSFPVTHSVLSARALLAQLALDYGIDGDSECVLLKRWMNDTYLVRAADERYVLRVYRAGWRSLPDIHYELDLLQHLARADVTVSIPLPARDGRLVFPLNAPEGIRYAVLFSYAPGEPPASDPAQFRSFGGAVARMHNAMDGFSSSHDRFQIDPNYLIGAPVRAIRRFLHGRPRDADYVEALAHRVRERIETLAFAGLNFGVCHGDVWEGNAHAHADGRITLFDFDLCGCGWRAYDLAVFHMAMRGRPATAAFLEAFLKGYTDQRSITDIDLEAIPWFVAARDLWHLGLHIANGQDWGFGWMDRSYLDRRMQAMRDWDRLHLSPA